MDREFFRAVRRLLFVLALGLLASAGAQAVVRTFNPHAPASIGAGGHASGPGGGVGVSAVASPPVVYSGCELPGTPNNIWYFDAVNGNDVSGDGSSAHPWQSLNNITTPANGNGPLLSSVSWWHRGADTIWTTDNSSAPIKPGDGILLRSGNYGEVNIGVSGAAIVQSSWITIQPAPNATVYLQKMKVYGERFYFNRITVEEQSSGSSDFTPRVLLSGDNFIFSNSVIDSVADASSWNETQWTTQIAFLGFEVQATCASINNNLIRNVINGLKTESPSAQVLVANNEFRYVAWDFIDVFATNYMLISKNLFLDHIQIYDQNAYHADVVQIQGGVASNYVVIDANFVNQITRANLFWPSAGMGGQYNNDLHGFTDFGQTVGGGLGYVVSNNVVITNASDGIYFAYSAAEISGNTVVGNTGTTGNTRIEADISGSLVRNNITNILKVSFAGVTADHNILNSQLNINGAWYNAPGSYFQTYFGNYVDGNQFTDLFTHFDPQNYYFDMTLKTGGGNPATGAGSASVSSPYDIRGATRASPPSIGAYEASSTGVVIPSN